MKKTIVILSIMLLLIGCGDESKTPVKNDNNTTQELNNTTSSVDDNYSIPLKYNYNKDGSAIQELLPLHVNRYEEIQTKLDGLRGDDEKFDNHYNWYLSELLSTQRAIDKHPSYAPRGNSKSLIVNVQNGKIDYSAYKLIGDIDENGEVDFEDEEFLKDTIANGNVDSKHDLNGDNKVDTKDMIEFISRIATEIKTFDFYTTSGKKLDIASRDFSDARSFSYGGSESKIMVVGKDINGVSGFTSGLSDIDTLWYVGLSTQKQKMIMKEGLEATNPDKINFVREAVAFLSEEPEEYLLGWKISVKFNTNDGLDRYGLEDMDTVYFDKLEDKIKPHFQDTDMDNPIKRLLTKSRYYYSIGAGQYEVKEDADVKHSFDLTVGSFETHIKSFRKTFKHSYKINDKTVFVRTIGHAASIVFTSKEDKTLQGKIKKDGEDVKGEVLKAKRVGPEPKDKEYQAKIKNSEYKLENIPFGAYDFEYEDKCGCIEILDSKFVFKKDGDKDLTVDKKEVKVKLTVRDKDNNLLDGKNVKIEPDECMVEKESFLDVSDNNAKVEFNDVPIGKYKVYVDGQESGAIQVCDEFDGEALGKPLWDIDFKFISKRNAGAPNSAMKDSSGEWHWKKIEISSITDSMNSIETATTLFDNGEYPYPIRLSTEGSTLLLLTNTTFFDEAENGLGLNYIESSPIMSKRYCINIDEGLLNNRMQELYPSYHPDAIPTLRALIFTASCGANTALDTSWMIDTSLSNSEVNAMKEYREFTVKSTGTWSDDRGKTTMTVKFTPSK